MTRARYAFTAKVDLMIDAADHDAANALCERIEYALRDAGIEIAPGGWVYKEPDFTEIEEVGG
jgi:hypothetical protein